MDMDYDHTMFLLLSNLCSLLSMTYVYYSLISDHYSLSLAYSL
jgi:hypothetical protein